METYLSVIATRMLQPLEELGEVQPSLFLWHHRHNGNKNSWGTLARQQYTGSKNDIYVNTTLCPVSLNCPESIDL